MALTQISTAGVKDDAVTSGKIPANAVGSSEIAANAVGSSEIADAAVTSTQIADATIVAGDIADATITLDKLVHGTSSNNGKFLRANNGADPSFETIPAGITINNQADNTLITCTGTTDTLNAESYWTMSGASLALGQASPSANIHLSNSYVSFRMDSDGSNNHTTFSQVTGTGKENRFYFGDAADDDVGQIVYDHNGDHMKFITGASERIRINGNGLQFNGDNSTANALDDYEEGNFTLTPTASTSGSLAFNSSYNQGSYTKIGNKVHVQAYLSISSNSSAEGYVELNSLPFTPADLADASGHVRAVQVVYLNSNYAYLPDGAGYYNVQLYCNEGNTWIRLYDLNGSGRRIDTLAKFLGGGADIFLNFSYFAA